MRLLFHIFCFLSHRPHGGCHWLGFRPYREQLSFLLGWHEREDMGSSHLHLHKNIEGMIHYILNCALMHAWHAVKIPEVEQLERLQFLWLVPCDVMTVTCYVPQGHDHTLSSVQYSKSGDQVITCGRDQMIKCWEVATGYCVRTLSGHTDWVKCLSLSIDGELIASGGHDQSIVVWRYSSGQKLQVQHGLL